MFKSIVSQSSVISILLFLPFIVSVFFAVFGLNMPAMLSTYLVVIFFVIILISVNGRAPISFLPLPTSLAFIGFLLVFVWFTFFSISTAASTEKLVLLIYLILMPIVLLLMVDYSEIYCRYGQFLKVVKLFSMTILLMYVVFFALGYHESFVDSGRLYLVGTGNPIWYSRNIIILMFCIVFHDKYFSKISVSSILIIPLGLYLLAEAGSRTPLISFFVAIAILYFSGISLNRRVLYGLSALLSGSLFYYIFSETRFFDDKLYSMIQRVDLYAESIELLRNNFMGYGIGSFGLLSWGEDVRFYPHNIFLEVALEMGVVGFFFFSVLILIGFKSFYKNNLFFYLFLISLVNAQLSGDLVGNNYIFIFLFLSVSYKKYFSKLGC